MVIKQETINAIACVQSELLQELFLLVFVQHGSVALFLRNFSATYR